MKLKYGVNRIGGWPPLIGILSIIAFIWAVPLASGPVDQKKHLGVEYLRLEFVASDGTRVVCPGRPTVAGELMYEVCNWQGRTYIATAKITGENARLTEWNAPPLLEYGPS